MAALDNITITTAVAERSRALSDWRDGMPSACAAAANGLRNPSAHASMHAIRLADVVPANPAGRGFYSTTKQDRPPRREPR